MHTKLSSDMTIDWGFLDRMERRVPYLMIVSPKIRSRHSGECKRQYRSDAQRLEARAFETWFYVGHFNRQKRLCTRCYVSNQVRNYKSTCDKLLILSSAKELSIWNFCRHLV